MQQLMVFNHLSLDGYFVDAEGGMGWAKARPDDAEWNAFVAANASGGATLVFGRVTYLMMAAYWPTPQAMEQNPEVAARMNELPKIVFSRTLREAAWRNTRLLNGDLSSEIRRLKAGPGEGMVILGSGTLVAQLSRARLVDRYQVVVKPLALGAGRTMFEGLSEPLPLRLTGVRAFANGNVVSSYEPVT